MTGALFTCITAICLTLTTFAYEFFEIAKVGITNTLFIIILVILAGPIINLFHKIIDKLTPQPVQQKLSWIEQSGHMDKMQKNN